MSNHKLGAINKKTGNFTFPEYANKNDEYECIECEEKLIICQGKIKSAYIRHYSKENNTCHYYTKPTPTQIHKNSVIFLSNILKTSISIIIYKQCISCDIIE